MSFEAPCDESVSSYYDRVSRKVKQLRQEKGISQLDMAFVLGQNSSAFYANAENRKHGKHFNLEHLFKISHALGLELWELLREIERENNKGTGCV